MAKTIKFNLICDGKPVRTIDDLRNNFCAEDIITYFRNGLLERWLTVRGFAEQLGKVKAIAPADDLQTVRELVKIFGVDDELTDIECDTYIFAFKKEHAEQLARYEAQNYKRKLIIEDYHAGYEALIDTIIDHKDDMPRVKAAIQEICEKYYPLFYMHHNYLGWLLVNDKAPMAMFAMLMRDEMRKLYLPDTLSADSLLMPMRENTDDAHNAVFNNIRLYSFILGLLNYDKLKEIFGDNLKEFAGATDGYWKDIEPKGRKFMLLRMESGNFVRPSGVNGGDMDYTAVNGLFPILDGIDYKSNSASHKLLYLEV